MPRLTVGTEKATPIDVNYELRPLVAELEALSVAIAEADPRWER